MSDVRQTRVLCQNDSSYRPTITPFSLEDENVMTSFFVMFL